MTLASLGPSWPQEVTHPWESSPVPHTGAHCEVTSAFRSWAPPGQPAGVMGSVFGDVGIFHSQKWFRCGPQARTDVDVDEVLETEGVQVGK